MIKTISFFYLISTSICGFSQTWEGIGNLNRSVQSFFEDSANDKLIIGGSFGYFNEDTLLSVLSYDGENALPMGCGFNWDCNTPYNIQMGGPNVRGIVRYHDFIYATGSFVTSGNHLLNGLAKWDGTEWLPVGTGLKRTHVQGTGYGLEVIDDELYVFGGFDSCAGIPANSIAKFNGTSWSDVHDFPLFGNQSIGIRDVALFNGELYAGGVFTNTGGAGDIANLVKYNGSQWVSVGDGIRGGFAGVEVLLEYHGKLYVGGVLSKAIGNPGNGIAAWDGMQWDDAGGGVTNGTHEIHVSDMIIFHDRLYVVGDITAAGGISTYDIASWDGIQWCGMGAVDTTFDNRVLSLGIFRDTLYVGGAFLCVDGDCDMQKIVKLIGPDYVAPCGNSTGINSLENQTFSIFPNPSSGQFTIAKPDYFEGQYSLVNLLEQEIQNGLISKQNSSFNINIESQSSGLYFLKLVSKDATTSHSLKLLKR